MTEKIFVGKCGGKDCRLREWTTNACAQSFRYCDNDHKACYKSRYENCPYGKTTNELSREILVNGIGAVSSEVPPTEEMFDIMQSIISKGLKSLGR